jgi:DHA2 family integral membrane protein (MFS transporter)
MGVVSTLRQIGAAFGIAILGLILDSGYRDSLSGHIAGLPAHLQSVAEGSVAAAAAVAHHQHGTATGSLLHKAYQGYAGGMSDVMLVCAGVTSPGPYSSGCSCPGAQRPPPLTVRGRTSTRWRARWPEPPQPATTKLTRPCN